MRIALISYECPPLTADGGIGTYVRQAAVLLQSRGHDVEVFAGCRTHGCSGDEDGLLVHRLQCTAPSKFRELVCPVFASRHALRSFDVVEGPEFRADASLVAEKHPDVALVVKLHTPTYLVQRLNAVQLGKLRRLRAYLGALRRRGKPFWVVDPANDVERQGIAHAHLVVSPSAALARIVEHDWMLRPGSIRTVPNPYVPAPELLMIAPGAPRRDPPVVLFVGRLELRKGILDLVHAAPHILKRYPHTVFRFVGRNFPTGGFDVREYILRRLSNWRAQVELVGPVVLDEMPKAYANADICVFPSVWENYPNVCLEAMAAARCIVASSAGGMREQLDDGRCGFLVEPRNPHQLADRIWNALGDPALRERLGRAARDYLQTTLGAETVGQQMESAYELAISYARKA